MRSQQIIHSANKHEFIIWRNTMEVHRFCFYISLSLVIFLETVVSEEIADAEPYLYKYGYLTAHEEDEGMIRLALKRYQKSIGLPQTGKLDTETKEMMRVPRCGMPVEDEQMKQKTCNITKHLWKTDYLTYKIKNWTESFDDCYVRDVFNDAIKSWTRNCRLTINESTTDSANLNLHFVKIEPDDKMPAKLGFAYAPEYGGIYLNSDEPLTTDLCSNDAFYAGWLVAHELGHALGLEHRPTKDSIMYAHYNLETLEPSAVDVNNLVALYGGTPTLNSDIICQKMSVDAMLSFNRRHMLIVDQYYWTFDKDGLTAGPFTLSEFFPIPEHCDIADKVDAAFSKDEVALLFKGDVYYRVTRRRLLKRKTVGGFNLKEGNFDAAMYDPMERVIYFFKGFMYMKYDGSRPKDESITISNISEHWNGIPNNIEAATLIENRTALFIKNSKCYFFNMETKALETKDCASDFFKCTSSD